jgi:hypothetical protein
MQLSSILCGVSLMVGVATAAVIKPVSVLVVSVADAGTGRPIKDAQIRLPQIGRLQRTDWIGEAKFASLANGAQSVQVRALGYAPSDVTVMVTGDTVGAVFMLERLSALDTVRVTMPALDRRLAEFEMHKRLGFARILDDSALAPMGNRDIAIVLETRFPGLRLFFDPQMPGKDSIVAAQYTGILFTPMNGCPVLLYLDGFLVQDGLTSIRTQDLAGIEYYDITSAPPQYRRPGQACKVLLFWSKAM